MTLSSIPPQLIPEVENETDDDNEQSKLLRTPRQHGTHATAKPSVVIFDDKNNEHKTSIISGTNNSRKNSGVEVQPIQSSSAAKGKRAMFQARRSITISTDEPLLPLKDSSSGRKSPFSKSPTSPSAILAKFKERIQHSLFINSTEWPSAAAILHERRKKANEQAKAQLHQKDLDMEAIQMNELSRKRQRCRRSDTVGHAAEGDVSIEDPDRFRRCRMRSDPVVYSTQKDDTPIDDDTLPPEVDKRNRDTAREAFRRRSISEDTYDRLPPTYIMERKQLQATTGGTANVINSSLASSQSSNNSGGVICSNEDLHEILNSYKREKSPTPTVAPSRTISADVSKYPRQCYSSQSSYANQTSRTPQYVTQTSVSSNISNDSSLLFHNVSISSGSGLIGDISSNICGAAGGSADTGSIICDSASKLVYSRLNSNTSGANIHVYPEVILDSCKGQAAVIGNFDMDMCSNRKFSDESSVLENTYAGLSDYVEKQDKNNERLDKDNLSENEDIQQPPEIIFDEFGQTWDVYGAEFDPEILGSAIQRHLDRLIKKTLEENNKKSIAGASLSDTSASSHNSQENQRKESSPKTLAKWWRYICLFGANNKLENEQTAC